MSLPDMGGLEVIRKPRSGPEALETHAVVVTGRSERQIRAYNRQAKELGIEEFYLQAGHARSGPETDFEN